jgi:septal ring factor EnvC (AmiA/AmiB activator)
LESHGKLLPGTIYNSDIPETESELKKRIEQINREIDEEEASINKLQSQINAFSANNIDNNKKKVALSESKDKSNNKLSLLSFIIIAMFALLFGVYTNK